MRILLDECVPLRFGRELPDHEVRSVPEMGWASQDNGALLALASGQFDVFITSDQRLSYQQAVSNFAIAVVVLVARRNKLEFLRPLIPELRRALAEVKPGEVRRAWRVTSASRLTVHEGSPLQIMTASYGESLLT